MPKVSIVMPVYNGEAYINEAIDSIIAQTFEDWEFIIVNEYGSSEAVTSILYDYEKRDRRIHVIQNETRLRIAESLNVGLRAATGEYIARMDADDIAGKERLAIQVAYMDQHPKIDICGLKVDMFGENTWEWNVYTDPAFLSCTCLFYTPFVHPTIMMRAASLQKHQLEYNKDFFYTEDYEFFERASHVLQFTNLEVPGTYFYRYLSTNATNVGGNQGLQLQNKVMAAAFERWDLHFTKDEIRILSPNTFPYALSADEAQDLLEKLDLLLKEVFLCKNLRNQFGIYTLFQVLHRRWMDAYESVRWRPEIMDDGQVQRAIDRGFFHREEFYTPRPQKTNGIPRVSVVIPTYNSESYIMDTIWSILEQDYDQFEVLIMNEKESEDRTKECIAFFEDPRIQVIQNETKLGLAKSLNLGFQLAKGEYIARADADDVYPKNRLRKQVEFLDANPEIDVCGSWQRHFGKRNYIHKPPASKEEMRANLIFKCEVCHSTVMLRRDKFVALDVIYDDRYLSEDYELWSRVANKMWFATIPEVLGEYRWNGENITAKKMDLLDIEAQKLVQRNLKQAIGIEIPDKDLILLSGWKNPFMEGNLNQENLRCREAALLDQIEEQNKKVKAIDERAFSKVLDERRVWAGIQKESVMNRVSRAIEKKDSGGFLKKMIKKLLKPLYRPFRIRYENRIMGIQDSVWRQGGMLEESLQTLHDVDGHLYDYYHDLEVKIQQQNIQIEMLQQTIGQILQSLTTTVGILERQLRSELEQQANLTRQVLLDQIKGCIEESEKNILQVTDMRVWKAEQLINQTMDARVWKAEQLINETTDARVWKAEQLINETTDARVWRAEQRINETTDARVWKAEQLINQTMDARMWKAEKNSSCSIADVLNELHRHIDFTYRDIMVAMENQKPFLPQNNIKLITKHPIAYESLDHLYPHGTIRDNTRYPRFVEKCEEVLGCNAELSFLDLGCSGGGMVLEAALRGHTSIGLEGSDSSKKEQRAEWRLLGDRLQTCDITKPFRLIEQDGTVKKFDIITAWEVMEHIQENDLPQMLENIKRHLSDRGYFIASIANWEDIDPDAGINWHVTLHEFDWWVEQFEHAGFEVHNELFQPIDMARGTYNPPHCYETPYGDYNKNTNFYIVVSLAKK